eukprot:Clim_evm14s134 gene=Clim_evmTU14s134
MLFAQEEERMLMLDERLRKVRAKTALEQNRLRQDQDDDLPLDGPAGQQAIAGEAARGDSMTRAISGGGGRSMSPRRRHGVGAAVISGSARPRGHNDENEEEEEDFSTDENDEDGNDVDPQGDDDLN